MNQMDQLRIGKLVQDRLTRAGVPSLRRVRVLTDEIRHEVTDGNWWYVPVSIHRDTEAMAAIYEGLSDIEMELQDKESTSVLLVPRIIPFQKWEDIA